MKNKRPTYSYPTQMQGFSIIEFLVASALSMIVLMAVTSTYFTARGLNSAATSRLTAQQELRQASTLLVRDARMAGGFGCFNMTNYGSAAIIKDESKAPFNLASNPGKDSLIPLSETSITYPGFSQSGTAVVFQYGIDTDEKSIPQNGLTIASSCTGVAKSASITDSTTARNILHISDSDEKKGTVSLMKHVVIAYAVGSIKGQTGLFRFQREDEKGTEEWGNPQLLIKDIQSMEMSYLYTENCPEDISASSAKAETFIRKDKLETGNTATTPALVRIQLNTTDNSSHQIEASVRGGNVCADRSI